MSNFSCAARAARSLLALLVGRATLSLGVATCLAASAADVAPSSPVRKPTFPQQGWVHKTGNAKLLDRSAPPVVTSANLVARMSIQDTIARYGIAIDDAQRHVLSSLFTDDAVFEVTEGSGKLLARSVGKAAVLDTVMSASAQQQDQRRHAISNVVFEKLTDTKATVLAYGIVTVAADGLWVGATVLYSIDLSQEKDGMWRMSRLWIGMDSYVGQKPTAKVDESATPQR